MRGPAPCDFIHFINPLSGEAYDTDANQRLYHTACLVASDAVKKEAPHSLSPSCHLFVTGAGLLMLVVVFGGYKVVDGVIAGPYLAGIGDLADYADKYGCEKIKEALKRLESFWDEAEMWLKL